MGNFRDAGHTPHHLAATRPMVPLADEEVGSAGSPMRKEDLRSQSSQNASTPSPQSTGGNASDGLAVNSIINVQGWLIDSIIDEHVLAMAGGDPNRAKQFFERVMAIGNRHVKGALRDMEIANREVWELRKSLKGHDETVESLRHDVVQLERTNDQGGKFVDQLQSEMQALRDHCVLLEGKAARLEKRWKKERSNYQIERDMKDSNVVAGMMTTEMGINTQPEGAGTKGKSVGKYPYYAVKQGRTPGVYASWAECEHQTSGFKNEYKGFKTREEADRRIQQRYKLRGTRTLSGASCGRIEEQHQWRRSELTN